MKLLNILTEPWVITQSKLDEIVETYLTHIKGDKIDIQGLEAKISLPFQSRQQEGYDVVNGIAVINVEDVLSKRLNFFTLLFGGTSYMQVEENVKAAMSDIAVKGVILNIDSPGGTVDGAFEAADAIAGLRGQKPMASYSNGMITSGAYLLGSATGRIIISSNTVQAGSIGVRTSRKDFSKALEKEGIAIHDISSGKQKSLGAPYKPMTEEERDIIKADVDHVAQLFFETVNKNMGLDIENIKALEGGVLRGTKAVKAGLVEGISTLDALIASMADGRSATGKGIKANADKQKIKTEVKGMDLEKLKAEHPDLVSKIEANAREGYMSATDVEAKIAEAKEAGATGERERIKDVKGQSMVGHEKLIEGLMFDGASTGGDAAMAVLNAEKTLRNEAAESFKADGKNNNVPPAEPGDEDEKTMKRKEFDALTPSDRKDYLAAGGKIVD